jgi:Cdc6-like AAA superfamily ATPase
MKKTKDETTLHATDSYTCSGMEMMNVSALSIAVQAGTPVLAWGPPGVGKTAVITAVAESLNMALEVVLASIREPADFSGLPIIREDGVNMEAPSWARRLAQAGISKCRLRGNQATSAKKVYAQRQDASRA